MKKMIMISTVLLSLSMGAVAAVKDTFSIGDLTYTVLTEDGNSGTVSVKATSTEISGKVIIPESVSNNGIVYTVTEIADQAFWKCSAMTSVKIPESITYVGSLGFKECTSLDSLVFPNDDMKFSYWYVCQGCTNLTYVRLPEHLASRFEVQPMTEHLKNGMVYMAPRGFSKETLKSFAPFIVRIKDLRSERYSDYNIGFPYREPGKEDVVGYEVRGYGNFKGKVTGTNSTTAAWIVSLAQVENPLAVRNVYFGESAYDIMAFYQANRLKLDRESSVFVSIGGTFANGQVMGIMRFFENAHAVDCFDNDLAGRIYGIRMASMLAGRHLNIVKTDDGVRISQDGKEVVLKECEMTLHEVAKHFSVSKRVSLWKPPKEYKDWNDVIMDRPWVQLAQKDKFERDAALEKRRSSKRSM